ncbi:MAG: PEP/pyruvate-binding domain-containing protein [Anaerolineaceae bacterium]|nr:PEP/pyruvate-binding domain-containing protein [Anaerolineaceae bacterium]
MTFPTRSTDRLLSIYLALAQYPILSNRIRAQMRRTLFERGIIQPQSFEAEARRAAIHSQQREGLQDPFREEPPHVWELRLSRVRDQLTDVIFSQHFGFEEFERIINEVLSERGMNFTDLMTAINPELAPQELVFEQAMTIERMPTAERSHFEARLQESKVVLIRTMISDQLRYVNIAKEWFTISDLAEIRRRKIGGGRIGGKAAGMLLALRILKDSSDPEIRSCLRWPDSYYIGSDEMYNFMSINNLVHWNDQKYKTEEEMRAEYPMILEEFERGAFLPDFLERLQGVLINIGRKPLIVRSSSLLEDNFGTAFAGKYESIFLPNQGTLKENLKALTKAIACIFASTLNPNALLYRRSRGLLDYDERMALILQAVEGEKFERYYLPHAAGVAFSRNLYRWAPQIRRDDGFVRLVWGLGTRAVDRVGNDFPRLVALSHPLLRPSNEPKSIRRYSQQYVDLIDLQDNQIKTLAVHDVITSHYPPLRYLAQLEEDGYFMTLRSNVLGGDKRRLVLTFDELLRRTPFAEIMRHVLNVLERSYKGPVDLEFTLQIQQAESGTPHLQLTVLQCRPQSHLLAIEQEPIPPELKAQDIVLETNFMVPQGYIDRVDYVLFVPPEGYYGLGALNSRYELGRAIGRLNAALARESFICVGPGRWGSSNSDLGVPID